jgi:hypothetical protein
MNVKSVTSYLIPAFIQWTVEEGGILLIDTKSNRTHLLGYPQAAVWALINRGYSAEKITSMLCAIASSGQDQVKAMMRDSLEEWLELGCIEMTKDNG